jgi:hypothetical protein
MQSYSEDNEDLIVCEYLASQKVAVDQVKYLDLGSGHPTIMSNTYYFYSQGASGVLVEALPWSYDLYPAERPRDVVLKAGVYWGENKQGYLRKKGKHGGGSYIVTALPLSNPLNRLYFPIPFVRVNDILANNFEVCPHYLSIDIEGCDFYVIKDLDFQKYPIPIICGEFKKVNMSVVDAFMLDKGYPTRKQTKTNFIYMR